jgi:hypothetical protein
MKEITMAKAAAKKPAGDKKKRAPFLTRFAMRIAKLKEWVTKTQPKFSSAPSTDVSDSLGAIGDSVDSIMESLPALAKWTPPTRSAAFAVGDTVTFKKDKLDELVKSGLYTKDDLGGEHEIVGVAGRKVKLECGVFTMLLVSKVKAE